MGKAFEKRKINSRKVGAPKIQTGEERKSLPNSLVMRVMESSEAEKEADRLSRGVTSKTPGDLMSEMGSRLGADFSDVQFHSDSVGQQLNYEVVNDAVRCVRESRPLERAWKKRIEEDYQSRKPRR